MNPSQFKIQIKLSLVNTAQEEVHTNTENVPCRITSERPKLIRISVTRPVNLALQPSRL